MVRIKQTLKAVINNILGVFGFKIVAKQPDMVLFEYENYEDYKNTQTSYNKEKIEQVWADQDTLNLVAKRINKQIKDKEVFGICHGSRN